MGYVATKSRPRYLDTDLKAEFAGDNPDYFNVKTNKWYSTSSCSELVTNGTFTSGTTGWTGTLGTSISNVSNTLRISVLRSNVGKTYTDISPITGKRYKLKLSYSQVNANMLFYCWFENSAGVEQLRVISGATSGLLDYEFIAQSGYDRLVVYVGGGSSGDGLYSIDNISVFQSDLTIGSEITPRNYLNNVVYADHNGQPEYVEEVAKVEYKDIIKANEYRGKNACTAWVNFDGTTTPPTIRDSFNVSSVIRTGTGIYDVYFTTAMDNVNYCTTLGQARVDGAGAEGYIQSSNSTVNKITITTETGGGSPAPTNFNKVDVQIFGGRN
jgi:hypothetical protein